MLEMGAMLAKHESGLLVPLSIFKANFHLDEPVLSTAIHHSERQLKRTQ
ncbi:hypothetical protein [Okeania sp. SIO2C2]|nr:hypothetical protein [Okeania sp. SIO2C2]